MSLASQQERRGAIGVPIARALLLHVLDDFGLIRHQSPRFLDRHSVLHRRYAICAPVYAHGSPLNLIGIRGFRVREVFSDLWLFPVQVVGRPFKDHHGADFITVVHHFCRVVPQPVEQPSVCIYLSSRFTVPFSVVPLVVNAAAGTGDREPCTVSFPSQQFYYTLHCVFGCKIVALCYSYPITVPRVLSRSAEL